MTYEPDSDDAGGDWSERLLAPPASFLTSNPRHAHEWTLFEQVKLPEGKVIIPGVIELKSNFIEHPDLVAQRIARYANLVGRNNVIAGSDCGFGTWVGQAARRFRRCVGQTGAAPHRWSAPRRGSARSR